MPLGVSLGASGVPWVLFGNPWGLLWAHFAGLWGPLATIWVNFGSVCDEIGYPSEPRGSFWNGLGRFGMFFFVFVAGVIHYSKLTSH